MARVTIKKPRGNRSYYSVTFFVFLLAAAGVGLYRLSPSLLDIGRIFRLAADRITEQSADISSAEPVLRGTIYDRNYRELAVSYLLYSVSVRPRELSNREDVVQALAEVTGMEPDLIEARLSRPGNVIKIAENLEPEEISALRNKNYAGVYVQPVETRFYPEHESTAGLIGYTSDGIGLAGAEGAYDMFLEHGEFKGTSLPQIDFEGEQVFGREAVDIVLTIDLDLQQKLERRLKTYLEQEQSSRGLAILIDSKTGSILAWAGSPSFNPNYYWQASEILEDSFFQEPVAPELYRDIEIRAAAIRKNGAIGSPLLPETVAAQEYGLQNYERRWFSTLAGTADETSDFFGRRTGQRKSVAGQVLTDAYGMNALQLAQTTTSLVNGGWLITPRVLASVYDHNLQKQFFGAGESTVVKRKRVVSPTMGIRLKRELLKTGKTASGDLFFHAASAVRMIPDGSADRHVMQKLFLGAIPAQSPVMVLVIVSQRDDLYPAADALGYTAGAELIAEFGQEILPVLMRQAGNREDVAAMPPKRDPSNYNQFLIGRRVDFQEKGATQVAMEAVMPELTGLSLRKGLQRLNALHLMVRIEGSGRIVSQRPLPGKPLRSTDECVLTLESKI